MLIQAKRKALDQIRPAANLIQGHIRGKPVIKKYNRDIELIIKVQAVVRRWHVNKQLEKVKRLRNLFLFACAVGKCQARFRKKRRMIVKIQRNVRTWLRTMAEARKALFRGVQIWRAKKELKRLRVAALLLKQIKAANLIRAQFKVLQAKRELLVLKKAKAQTDIARVWKGYQAMKLANILRAQRIVLAAIEVQGYYKTLYCRTLLMQFQATKSFHKAGKLILGARTMNRMMDFTGRHHLMYLNPKKLKTHNYSMPARTAQGKPNPKLGTVIDKRKYVCLAVTPIPYYKYPDD